MVDVCWFATKFRHMTLFSNCKVSKGITILLANANDNTNRVHAALHIRAADAGRACRGLGTVAACAGLGNWYPERLGCSWSEHRPSWCSVGARQVVVQQASETMGIDNQCTAIQTLVKLKRCVWRYPFPTNWLNYLCLHIFLMLNAHFKY